MRAARLGFSDGHHYEIVCVLVTRHRLQGYGETPRQGSQNCWPFKSVMGTDMRDIVNDQDEIIGQASKEEIAAQGLICRVAFIMLANNNGDLILHQRAATKKTYPLFWSGAAAGHVEVGESYAEAAYRELMEELGVNVSLTCVGKFYSEPDREMVGVFLGFYDGPITIDPREVAQVETFSMDKLARGKDSMHITSFVERSLPLVLPRILAAQH